MYQLCRKILFAMPEELSHELSLDWLGAADRVGLLKLFFSRPQKPVKMMGLEFPNPVGLAAGLDKNGDYFHALGNLGFGFVEIGTVTPLPQAGNESPRLFRLPEYKAIINRMGFNNLGVQHLAEQVRKKRFKGILGINIGKNKSTPEAQALSDYEKGLEAIYELADYITINISSPNTPGLRDLQYGAALDQLLAGIQERAEQLSQQHGKAVPIAVKIAPDLEKPQVIEVADALVRHSIAAVIATNTTIHREAIANHRLAQEAGGLSGAPLASRANEVIYELKAHLQGELPIIGVGGILSADDVRRKIDAGADMVQLYSGLIYKGPKLIKEACAVF